LFRVHGFRARRYAAPRNDGASVTRLSAIPGLPPLIAAAGLLAAWEIAARTFDISGLPPAHAALRELPAILTDRESLLNNRDNILYSKQLVTIDTDVAVEFDVAAMKVGEPDVAVPFVVDLDGGLDAELALLGEPVGEPDVAAPFVVVDAFVSVVLPFVDDPLRLPGTDRITLPVSASASCSSSMISSYERSLPTTDRTSSRLCSSGNINKALPVMSPSKT